jgi:hypothetical protein
MLYSMFLHLFCCIQQRFCIFDAKFNVFFFFIVDAKFNVFFASLMRNLMFFCIFDAKFNVFCIFAAEFNVFASLKLNSTKFLHVWCWTPLNPSKSYFITKKCQFTSGCCSNRCHIRSIRVYRRVLNHWLILTVLPNPHPLLTWQRCSVQRTATS